MLLRKLQNLAIHLRFSYERIADIMPMDANPLCFPLLPLPSNRQGRHLAPTHYEPDWEAAAHIRYLYKRHNVLFLFSFFFLFLISLPYFFPLRSSSKCIHKWTNKTSSQNFWDHTLGLDKLAHPQPKKLG